MKVLLSDLADKANIKFGTSGLRGLVTDLSDEVCFAYTQAFLQSTPLKDKRVIIGHDLRPSSPRNLLSPERGKKFEQVYFIIAVFVGRL